MPWLPPSKRVIAGGDIGEAAVEFEFDRPRHNTEAELAIGAVFVFPASVFVSKEVVAGRLVSVRSSPLALGWV